MTDAKPTEEDIKRNLLLVEEGKALDMPLSVLNGQLKNEAINKPSRKAYQQTPQYKAYQKAYKKAYQQTPQYKASQKAYQQTPQYKASQKAYQQTPQYKASRKAYKKAYYLKNRGLILAKQKEARGK